MSKFRRLIKFLQVLFLLGVLWSIIFLVRFISSTPQNTNRDYIPEDSPIVIILDGRICFEELFVEMVLEQQDDDILHHLLEKVADSTNQTDIGIDFLSDIIFFSIEREDHFIDGYLFNLINPSQFESSFGKQLGKHEHLEVLDGVGLILSETQLEEGNELSKSDLISIGGEIFRNRNETSYIVNDYLVEIRQNGHWINIWQEENAIVVKGMVDHPPSDLTIPDIMNLRQIRSNEGLQIASHIVPDFVNDSLRNFLGESFPELEAFSLNVNELNLVNNKRMMIVPNFETLLYFNDTIDITDFINAPRFEALVENVGMESFRFNDVELQYKQLSDTSVYLGQSPFDETRLMKIAYALSCTGDVSVLTEVKGNALLTFGMSLSPVFSASKQLTSNISGFESTIVDISGSSGMLRTRIDFKDGHTPTRELILFLVESGLLK